MDGLSELALAEWNGMIRASAGERGVKPMTEAAAVIWTGLSPNAQTVLTAYVDRFISTTEVGADFIKKMGSSHSDAVRGLVELVLVGGAVIVQLPDDRFTITLTDYGRAIGTPGKIN